MEATFTLAVLKHRVGIAFVQTVALRSLRSPFMCLLDAVGSIVQLKHVCECVYRDLRYLSKQTRSKDPSNQQLKVSVRCSTQILRRNCWLNTPTSYYLGRRVQ